MNREAVATLVFLTSIAAPAACGCGRGAVQSACLEASAAVAAVGAYVDEAQYAVDRARNLAESLPKELRADALKAVEAAEASLFVVSKVAATASAQCRSLDVPSLFRDFAEVWEGVKGLLDVFGGPEAGGLVDPSAYEIGKEAK